MPNNHQTLNLFARAVAAASLLGFASGCAHHSSPSPAPTQVTAAVPTPSSPPFQPFVLINQPAPVPQATTHQHRYLKLTQRAGHAYLADSNGRYYDAGRDEEGRLYPVYHDPATNQYYPLLYDSNSDQYYRVLHTDDGHYYRCYVGDSSSRFYQTDDTYAPSVPPPADCPVVEDSGNTSNNYDGAGYDNYAPQVESSDSHRDAWLWAIPVIVGAYLLLSRHHHSSPQSVYYVQPSYNRPVIVQQINIIDPINSPVTIYQNGRYVTYSEAVMPPEGCSPIFLGSPPRREQPWRRGDQGGPTRVWQETGFNVTRVPRDARRYPSEAAFDQSLLQAPEGPPRYLPVPRRVAFGSSPNHELSPPVFGENPPSPQRRSGAPSPPSQWRMRQREIANGPVPAQQIHRETDGVRVPAPAQGREHGLPRNHPATSGPSQLARSNFPFERAVGQPTIRRPARAWPTAAQPRIARADEQRQRRVPVSTAPSRVGISRPTQEIQVERGHAPGQQARNTMQQPRQSFQTGNTPAAESLDRQDAQRTRTSEPRWNSSAAQAPTTRERPAVTSNPQFRRQLPPAQVQAAPKPIPSHAAPQSQPASKPAHKWPAQPSKAPEPTQPAIPSQ